MRLCGKYGLMLRSDSNRIRSAALTCAVLLLFVAGHNYAQEGERYSNPYFENFTTADKLPFDKINSGIIDQSGFLWFGSVHGILRYDGYEFKTYRNRIGEPDELLEGRVEMIVEDRLGYLWIGGTKGLSRMDVKTGDVLRLTKDLEKYPLLGSRTSFVLMGPEGFIWIRTELGLNRINPVDLSIKSWNLQQHLDSTKPIYSRSTFSWDKKEPHIMWLGSEKGLLKLNTNTDLYEHFITPFFDQNHKEMGLEYDYHSYVYADSSGTIYTGRWGKSTGKSRNEGMYVFDSKTETWRTIKLPIGPANSQSIRGFQYKSPNELWVLTPNRGIGIFNRKTEEFSFINHEADDPHSIAHPSIRLLLFDENDNMIVGTIFGLSFSYKQRTIFQYHELIPEEVNYDSSGFFITDVLETNDAYFITSYRGGGLCVVDKKTKKAKVIPLSDQKGFPHQAGFKVIEDHLGKYYIASREGLKVYDANLDKMEDFITNDGESIHFETPVLYSIIEDSEDRLWVGSESDGLIQISPNRDSVIYHNIDGIGVSGFEVAGRISGLCEDNTGEIWISSYSGTKSYDVEKDMFTNYSDTSSVDNYLSNNFSFNCVTDSLGRIWLSSYVLFCIDETQPSGKKIKQLSTKDGLPGSIVRAMRKHPDGTIWMVTDNGLLHLNPYSFEMEVYTTREGLSRDQMWDENFYINEEGKIRLFTKRGYLEYHPEVEASLIKSRLAFTKFEVNGEEISGYKEINFIDTISLHYSQNSIAFGYALLNYAPKMDNVYSYKLEGVDDEWIDAGKRHFTEYKNLPGGYYTFYVKAKDKLGNDGANVLSKLVFIGTPFWKTTWFKILIGALVLLLLYSLYRYRIQAIRKEKDLLARLNENEMIALRAQMNPHFLFNTINSIKRFIIKNETEAAANHLTKFARLVRLILNNSNSQSIALQDEMEALKLYIEMEAMRFDDKFDYSLDISNNINAEEVMIPPMLLQPFVENAIWHGLMHKKEGRGRLSVGVSLQDGVLECVVLDNGIGRTKAAEIKSKSAIKKKSLGMTLTQRRIELMDKFADQKIMKIGIEDLVDDDGNASGTRVTIRIPIQEFKYKD